MSKISKTVDGASYAYTNLDLEKKALDDLGDSLRLFQHLRVINISKNNLRDLSELVYLPHLVEVNASEN